MVKKTAANNIIDLAKQDEISSKIKIYKWHNLIKYICESCGNIKYYSATEYILRFLLIIFITIFSMIGVISALHIYDEMINNNQSLMGFYLDDKISMTKMQQLNELSDRYSNDLQLQFYTQAKLDKYSYIGNLTDWLKILILHNAIIDDTIYIKDKNKKDILYSPWYTLQFGGDCEDRTALFLTMAKISELQCYPASSPRHAFAYCLYENNKIVFIDSSNNDIGLSRNLIFGDILLYNTKINISTTVIQNNTCDINKL